MTGEVERGGARAETLEASPDDSNFGSLDELFVRLEAARRLAAGFGEALEVLRHRLEGLIETSAEADLGAASAGHYVVTLELSRGGAELSAALRAWNFHGLIVEESLAHLVGSPSEGESRLPDEDESGADAMSAPGETAPRSIQAAP